MPTLFTAAALMLALFALWGFGTTVRRMSGAENGAWPVSIGIGLAVTVFAGGFLNLAHIAYGPALWIIVATGVVLGGLQLRRFGIRTKYNLRDGIEIAFSAAIIAAIIFFASSTQLPPRAFNFHDDFQKYFVYVARMLGTGTLAAGPLSSLGWQALGGQAFLQGFVVSVLPIGYINGVDAVFGLLLLMIIAAWAGWQRFGWFPGAMLGPLLIVTINPQYTNVSPLYLGGALMATAVLLLADNRETTFPPPPIILGLVYASLIALKPTFAVFVLCHFPLSVVTVRSEVESWKRTSSWAAGVLGWGILGIAPWLALGIPNYFVHAAASGQTPVTGFDGKLSLLSTKTLFYGDSFAHYAAIVLVGGVVAVWALAVWRSQRETRVRRGPLGIFAGAAAGVLSYVMLVPVLGARLEGYETGLRFAIPFMMGTCIVCLMLAPSLSGMLSDRFCKLVPIVATAVIIIVFAPSAVGRYRQAVQSGTILAFSPDKQPQSAAYFSYNQFCLSTAARQYILQLQDKVPPGEAILVWINTPFLLDFKRNKIIEADTAGISSPWAHIPNDVHYYLWQYRGYGVRTEDDYAAEIHGSAAHERLIALQSLAFTHRLSEMAKHAEVIESNGSFVLFRVSTNTGD